MSGCCYFVATCINMYAQTVASFAISQDGFAESSCIFISYLLTMNGALSSYPHIRTFVHILIHISFLVLAHRFSNSYRVLNGRSLWSLAQEVAGFERVASSFFVR